MVKGRTGIAQENILGPIKGTWLEIEGTVENVSDRVDHITVWVERTNGDPAVFIDFKKGKHDTYFAALRKGDRFRAKGKISSAGDNTIHLDSGIL